MLNFVLGGSLLDFEKKSWKMVSRPYPKLISQLEVCLEGWVKKGGTRRTLRVPDQRHVSQGHS